MPNKPPAYRPAKQRAPTRGTRTERGYDNAWGRWRLAYLREHPLCVDCKAQGFIEPAREVHHIRKVSEAPELKMEETNVMALCKPCHSRRTARGE